MLSRSLAEKHYATQLHVVRANPPVSVATFRKSVSCAWALAVLTTITYAQPAQNAAAQPAGVAKAVEKM